MKHSILWEFYSFLKGELPISQIETNLTVKHKILILGKIYFYLILFSIAASLILVLLSQIFDTGDTLMPKKDAAFMINNKYAYAFLLLVIVPVYEEIAFRNLLIQFNKVKFFISTSLILSFIIINTAKGSFLLIENSINVFTYYLLLFITGAVFFVILNVVINDRVKNRIRGIWDKNFLLVFYLVTMLFWGLHLWENNLGEINFLLLIQSFILLAFSFIVGYIRIKLNILFAIILHVLFNLPSVLVRLIYF